MSARTVIKSKYYKVSVLMWSDECTGHAIDEPGRTKCGVRYRTGFKYGWFVEDAFVTCKRCLAVLHKEGEGR